MPQKVLLPSDSPIAGAEWRPTGPIPASVREFGKFPNIEQWLPADLFLVSAMAPDAVTRQIINAQVRGGFSADDARWQHAAVYLGEGYVIEATLHGVRYAPIYPSWVSTACVFGAHSVLRVISVGASQFRRLFRRIKNMRSGAF